MIADYGVPADAVHVVGLGAHPIGRAIAREWSVPRFVFIGYDWHRKSGMLLDAFASVRQEFPQARLDLVGDHPRVDLEGVTGHGEIRRGDKSGRQFLGKLLEQATTLVVPSDIEPFGIIYVEAGLAGVPSIGTTVGGAADAIGDGGLVVPPRDVASLLDAMRQLANPELSQHLGRLARQHAVGFTWERVAQRTIRALALEH